MKTTYLLVLTISVIGLRPALLGAQWADNDPHSLGWLNEDPRNIPWFKEHKPDAIPPILPAAVDHSAHMPPVRSQGSSPSCTAWALCYYYKTYQEWMEHGWSVLDSAHQFSPAFAYNQASRGGTLGSYASDIMKVIVDQGCANLYDSPFNAPDHTTWPSETAYYHALTYRAQEAVWIDCRTDPGILALKQHISEGDNADLGFYVWGNFDNINSYDTTYCVADKTGNNRGGHHICLLGYDDAKVTHDGTGAFRLVNSWGTGWGNQGYAWISYEAVKDAELSGRWVCYLTDRTAYSPSITARYRADHAKREYISLTAGIGTSWSKDFYNWQLAAQAGNPFPAHDVILDLSDGAQYLDACDTNPIYIQMSDNLADGVTGTIRHLTALSTDWGLYSPSPDSLVPIPDDNSPAYARLRLPTHRTDWQCAQHFPSRTGFSSLTGDMDTANLKWSYATGTPILTAPAIGDLNGDGTQEIVICPLHAPVTALDGASGDTVWTATLGSSNEQPPCLGDVNGDARLEVVTATFDGHVYALNGQNGSVLWTWPGTDLNPSAPCLNDLDGDGRLEVGFCTGSPPTVVALNAEDGSLLWRQTSIGQFYVAAPAVADVNGDGQLEVVVGTMDHHLYTLKGSDGSIVESYDAGGEIWDPPAIADIDADGRSEIVFSTVDNLIYAINGENDSLLWSHPGGEANYWPAIGDIDNDGRMEVVCDAGGTTCAFNGEDGSPLWSVTLLPGWSCPVLCDVNGDNQLEVLTGSQDSNLYALRGSDGARLWTFKADAGPAALALGDIDNDGNVEAVFGSYAGTVHALDGRATSVTERPAPRPSPLAPSLAVSPNPVSGIASIVYSLPAATDIRLDLYDASGRLIRTLISGLRPSGTSSFILHPSSLSRGIYFCRLETPARTIEQKVVIAR